MDTRSVALVLGMSLLLLSGSPLHAQDDAVRDAIGRGDWESVAETLGPLVESAEPPENAAYWYGVALFHQEEYGNALPHLAKALEAQPESLAAARYLARAGYEKASPEAVEAALAAFPGDPEVLTAACALHFRLASFLYKQGDAGNKARSLYHERTALELGRLAIAVDPLDARARITLARVLHWVGENGDAAAQLRVADRLEPLSRETYDLLGRCQRKLGDHEGTLEAYSAAAEVGPGNALEFEWQQAVALSKLGRHEEAKEIFRSIFARQHAHPVVRFHLGRSAYDAGDYALALFCFREACNIDDDIEGLVWSARCAYDLEQDRLARTLIDRAFAEAEANEKKIPAHWHFVRGRILWQLGEKKAAAADLEKAVEKERGNEEYLAWAVFAYRELDDPLPIVYVVGLYGRVGDPHEALRLLRGVLAKWPGPRAFDPRAARYGGGMSELIHTNMSRLYDRLGLPRLGWSLYKRGLPPLVRPVDTELSWMAVRAGDLEGAAFMFGNLRDRGSDWGKQLGRLGLAYLALQKGDGKEAKEHIAEIKDERMQTSVPTARRWAEVLEGNRAAADEMDMFDLLGVYGYRYRYGGFRIQGLLPQSPLAASTPGARPNDVVLEVDGHQLRNDDAVVFFRKAPVPEGPIPVTLRRGDAVFEVDVDLWAVREALKTKGEER